jgi:hypothetical protein
MSAGHVPDASSISLPASIAVSLPLRLRMRPSTRTVSTFDASGEANWIAARGSADDYFVTKTVRSLRMTVTTNAAEGGLSTARVRTAPRVVRR